MVHVPTAPKTFCLLLSACTASFYFTYPDDLPIFLQAHGEEHDDDKTGRRFCGGTCLALVMGRLLPTAPGKDDILCYSAQTCSVVALCCSSGSNLSLSLWRTCRRHCAPLPTPSQPPGMSACYRTWFLDSACWVLGRETVGWDWGGLHTHMYCIKGSLRLPAFSYPPISISSVRHLLPYLSLLTAFCVCGDSNSHIYEAGSG